MAGPAQSILLLELLRAKLLQKRERNRLEQDMYLNDYTNKFTFDKLEGMTERIFR